MLSGAKTKEQASKEILRAAMKTKKEPTEPDYNNEEKSGKEGEDKQEEQMGEITGATTNQVF